MGENSRPSTSLRGAGSRSKGRVNGVDIDGEVDWSVVANTVVDLLDDTSGANSVDLTSLNDLKANVAIVLIVR